MIKPLTIFLNIFTILSHRGRVGRVSLSALVRRHGSPEAVHEATSRSEAQSLVPSKQLGNEQKGSEGIANPTNILVTHASPSPANLIPAFLLSPVLFPHLNWVQIPELSFRANDIQCLLATPDIVYWCGTCLHLQVGWMGGLSPDL